MPIPRPTPHAIAKEVSRASRAAASAGTTWSGSEVASSCVTDAARTPTYPSTTLASSVLTIDSSCAERPASSADSSFSEAARVASPNLVRR